MNWTRAKLKFVARFDYGDAIPTDEVQDGPFRVFGSNGPYALFSRSNTGAPAIVVGRKGSYGKINWTSEPCFASDTTFFIDSSTSRHELRWVYWLLQTLGLDEGTDEAAVPGLNRETAYSKDVAVPAPSQQRAIADYLDRETARLDALIAAKQRLLRLLAEKRRALITDGVTRGLDSAAPLHDSGIPWLGEIPAHWRIERLKFHLHSIEQGWSPMCDNTPAGFEEWGVLKAGCVNGWNFDPSENKRLPDDVEPLPEYEVRQGDVLMSRANTTALLGSTAIVHEVRPRLLMCDKLYRLGVNDATINREYLVAFLRIPAGRHEFERDATGASNSMQNIGQDSVRNLWVPIPPLHEQREIVAHMAQEVSKIENVRSATERTIALLKERRAALIAAAVTGQLGVAYS